MSAIAANAASERSCLESCLRSAYLQCLHNVTKDMLDALDLNSSAKARQNNLQFIVTAHMEL